jgi:hypothetical protein
VSADPSGIQGLVRRVRRRALALSAISIAAGFAFGLRTGLSLTICAAVVIFSFLVLEKLLDRLGPRQAKVGIRALVPLLLVTGGSFVLLALVLWRWKGFDPVAGAIGLSMVVLAVVPEVWRRE